MIKKSILDILVDQKSITEEQKQTILSRQPLPKDAEHVLLEEGIIQDTDLAKAYATKFEYEYIDTITERTADPTLLAQVPLKFLRENTLIPLKKEDGTTIIVTSDPFDYQSLDEISLQLDTQAKGVATPATIINAINRFYPLEGTKEMIEELAEEQALAPGLDFGTIEEEDILGMVSEAPIIKLVNHILYQAVKREASDIHIEPFEKELRIRYRIDGILYTIMTPPKRVQSAIASRIKIMAHLNIAEKRQPQDGRIQIKIADKAIDIRVSVLPTAFGEKIVMRLLDKSRTFGALTTLGFSKRDYETIEQIIKQPNGIFLITGPTGSGKTSTLYSILNELNSPQVNIVTVEDPVEYQMMGINQVQVNDKIGLTFAAALRSILRQDPDIIMIGETRDQETAQIAIQAALTGHLVLSTLHTNSAAATITRLLDMGLEPFLLASTILAVMAQRLVRKLCMHCRKSYKPEPEILKRLGISPEEAKKHTFYEAKGCDECLETGYRGRLAIFEIMVMSPALARLTIDHADTYTIQKQAEKEGMTLLIHDGIRKILEGLTTIAEVLAVATTAEDSYE